MTRLPRHSLTLITAALGVLAAPLAAKDKDVPSTPPPVFQAVLDCKSVADAAERLACYDRTVGAMATARDSKDLVIADRATTNAKRQELFGLADKPAADEAGSLQAKIAALTFNSANGTALITLDNGQVWRTTSNGTLTSRLRTDQTVMISASGLFGFRLRIEGRTGFQGVSRVK